VNLLKVLSMSGGEDFDFGSAADGSPHAEGGETITTELSRRADPSLWG
jgi:hypothetical protein